MRIKLDENLPVRLADRLQILGHDVHTLQDERLQGCADLELWEAVQNDGRFLITQDMDFSDTRKFVPGMHHGILLVRLHTPNRQILVARIDELFQRENVVEWSGCLVVATDRKIRVVRPAL
jgi:predicted nuclease of predicted toxin-antitoxin system